tara:strand:- start:39 stop:917 length:879 start_codon:yes stop_codon:yes gene_type:complete
MANDQSSNPDNAQQTAEDAMFGSTESFFDALDNDVNGIIKEDSPVENKEATPEMDPRQSTDESGSEEPSNDNWKQRYSDSTREAQRIKAELDELKPYSPVLEAMKKDSGLVEHVRDYFKKDEKSIRDNLNLDEDFRFDTDDLIENPDSQSRKVFNAMVDGVVKERTSEMINRENAVRQQETQKDVIKKQAEDFRVRNNLTVDQMRTFLSNAEQRFKGGALSFDDMYALLNRDNMNRNVATATKEDMLTQMKNVRDIPTSQGNANNAGEKSSPDDDIFDALNSVDGNLDNMFG